MPNQIRVAGPFITEINPLPLFSPVGDVTRYFEARLLGVKRRAMQAAPNGADSGRTFKTKYNPEPFGYLKANIFGEMSHPGPLEIAFEITAEARYALFVIKGTRPIIYGKQTRTAKGTFEAGGTRKTMYLPPNFGYRAGVPVSQVRGQRANDFLSRAVNEEAAHHTALLGYDRT